MKPLMCGQYNKITVLLHTWYKKEHSRNNLNFIKQSETKVVDVVVVVVLAVVNLIYQMFVIYFAELKIASFLCTSLNVYVCVW